MPEHLVDHGVLPMSYHCRHRPFRWSAPIENEGGLPFKQRPVLLPARCTEILGIADSKERQVRAATTAGPHHFATFREQARRISFHALPVTPNVIRFACLGRRLTRTKSRIILH